MGARTACIGQGEMLMRRRRGDKRRGWRMLRGGHLRRSARALRAGSVGMLGCGEVKVSMGRNWAMVWLD